MPHSDGAFLASSLIGLVLGATYSRFVRQPEKKPQVAMRRPIKVFRVHVAKDGTEIIDTEKGTYFRKNGSVRGPY